MTEVAVIADIHGNVWALDAVLADIKRRGITTIINLGDHVYGPMAPAATIQRIMSESMINISGNEDTCLFLPESEAGNFSSYHFSRSQLNAEQLAWLQSLPPTAIVGEMAAVGDIFCCHGTQDSNSTYMLETVTEHGVSLTSDDKIYNHLKGITQSLVVCGHTHIPRSVSVLYRWQVVNPGSVGVPAYTDDQPYPHVMEAGSPHARYAVLDQQPNGWWNVENISLVYDWAHAADACRQNGREDWATWIETGRAS